MRSLRTAVPRLPNLHFAIFILQFAIPPGAPMPTPHIRFERPPGPAFMRSIGLVPDAWQTDVLDGNHRRLLLNCSRQAGKSTVVAMLSLLEASFVSGALVLILSRSLRQSAELFSRVVEFHKRMGSPHLVKRTAHELRLKHERRILSLPCSEPTIRGFSDVHMIVIDEAARVPDDLYLAVRPMTAVNPDGRIVLLSTPCGKRGFFYDAWANGGPDWTRIEVPATQVSRIKPEHLEDERRTMGEAWFRQEYFCSFESREGVVYPDFKRCIVLPSPGTPGEGSGVRASAPATLTPSPSPGVPGEGSQSSPTIPTSHSTGTPASLYASLPSPGTPGEGSGVR